MSDVTVPIAGLGTGTAPLDYTVHGDQVFTLLGIRAIYDGSAAASSWLPAVQILTGDGTEVIHTQGTAVLAGGSAKVSFFPRVKRSALSPVTLTYYQVVAALASTNSLVGQWHLTEGASPYADTSGSVVGGNAQLLIQVAGTAMTQNNPSGPLTSSPGGPSVAFNYDGNNPPALGDLLHTSLAPLGRFSFLGNLPYTVVAWIKPVAGTNLKAGGVVGDVKGTNFGLPAEFDDGWQIAVKSSTLECTLSRYCHVIVGGTPDTVSLGAMSTTEWTMVTMSYDGATLRGYANGAPVASTASAGAIGDAQDVLAGVTQAGPDGIAKFYLGAVAEVTVWASQLSDDQIALLYLSGTA